MIRSAGYYRTRTVVRFALWSTLAVVAVLASALLLELAIRGYFYGIAYLHELLG